MCIKRTISPLEYDADVATGKISQTDDNNINYIVLQLILLLSNVGIEGAICSGLPVDVYVSVVFHVRFDIIDHIAEK